MKSFAVASLLLLSSCATQSSAHRTTASAASLPGTFECTMTKWDTQTDGERPTAARPVTIATQKITLDQSTPEGFPVGYAEMKGLPFSIRLTADREGKDCAIHPCPWPKGTVLARLTAYNDDTGDVAFENMGNPYKAFANGPAYAMEKHFFFAPVGEVYLNCKAAQ